MRAAQLLTIVLLMESTGAYCASQKDLLSMSLDELVNLEVNIATGTPKSLRSTPAATSIITATELEAMGAQDIDEALELVPGLHVSHSSFVYAPRYFMRGIVSDFNPHTLVLINGIPRTTLFTGDRSERIVGMSGLPVHMIDRIEIIRGPGSAVYGADAFAGVINVITRKANSDDDNQASLAYGSFNTGRASLRQRHTFGSVHTLFSLMYGESDGDNPIITVDNQSMLDALFGTQASYAPGPANLAWENFDARGELQWGNYRLRMSYRESESETAHGINESLDPTTRYPNRHATVDMTWSDPQRWQDWDIEGQISYAIGGFRNPTYTRQYPPGAFGGLFPDGLLQKPELSEENARIQLTALYTGINNHRIRMGTGFYWGDIFKTTDSVNYVLIPNNPIPQPVPLHSVSDTNEVFLPENQRTTSHVFLQDEWLLGNHWELTTGIRHDNYSDVGDTINPRVALVWTPQPTFTTKLLYGEAFRPPAFSELYARNNPIALGNPTLKPEQLKSMELALSWEPVPGVVWDINLYKFHIRDFIDFVNDPSNTTVTAQNIGRIKGQGVETEVRYQWKDNVHVLANYSHQHTQDIDTHTPLGLTPEQDASLRLHWEITPFWMLTPQLVWLSETRRPNGDNRPDLDGYTIFDVSMRHQMTKKISASLIVRNLFDADVREASQEPDITQPIAPIPNDLPQPGRSLTLQLTSRW